MDYLSDNRYYPNQIMSKHSKLILPNQIQGEYLERHFEKLARLLFEVQNPGEGFLGDNSTNYLNWQDAFDRLKTISRTDAFDLLSTFPKSIVGNTSKSPITEEVKLFYQIISAWLLTWELQQPVIDSLNVHGAQELEAYALLSEARFKICRGIIQYDTAWSNCFKSPNFLWLLWEAAECRTMLFSEISSKKEYYQKWRKATDALSPQEPQSINKKNLISPAAKLTDFIEKANLAVEQKAKSLAISHLEFDTGYLRPYQRARQTWGKKSDLKDFCIFPGTGKKKKPGRKLGQKNKI